MTDVENEAKTTAKKAAKAASAATEKVIPFELPKFEVPKFELPKMDFAKLPQVEVPPVFREMAEKGLAQAKDGYEKFKTVAEETTDALEDTYEAARTGMLSYNLKAIDALKANADATFGLAKDLAGAKTFGEMVELQTAFLRSQFETVAAQVKDLQAHAQKVATEAAQPAKDAFAKTMKDIKAA